MATNNQNESALPTPNDDRRSASDLLPRFFRTEANKKFLQSTLDQLIQPGVAEKINSYYGRKTAKAFKSIDNYVGDVSADRENYQLEPATVIKDDLDNVTFYKDYNDYINQLSNFGANTDNHSVLNSQDSYPWSPHINWDKFVNFREYYWAPQGPLPVPVTGQSRDVVSTYTVSLVDNDGDISYLFSPDGKTPNPSLKLYRGQKYRFEIDTPGHPMAFSISRSFTPGNTIIVSGREGIKSPGLFDATLYGTEFDAGEYIVLPSSGSVTFDTSDNVSTIYPDGIRKLGESGEEVANVYIDKGVVEFTIPDNAPDNLFYISKHNVDVSGKVRIYDIEENSFLNINNDIIGKKTYLSANGIELSNGMKVFFRGDTIPVNYQTGLYYVEGVGSEIKLIKEDDLIITAAYTEDNFIPYDSDEFDRLPFSNASAYAATKDYVIVNRASNDKNAWARYNKWFHKDVLAHSFTFNNVPVNIDETFRAKRPIIEFDAGLKLDNFGSFAKQDVDLIDTFTADVFSNIEGQLGYIVDGISLAPNMRVLFANDNDPLVNSKIYTVKFVTIKNDTRISLIETTDTTPLDLETVFVTKGTINAGKTFHYHGNAWVLAQEKLTVNQSPLFELFDAEGISYNDTTVYSSVAYAGNKLFSFKQGTGTNDSELGFPLSYKNLANSGDIVFEFNLLTDTFANGTETIKTDTSFIKQYTTKDNFVYKNGWSSTPAKSVQKVIQQFVVDETSLTDFAINVYDNSATLTDLSTFVYVNRTFKIVNTDYTIVSDAANNAYVRFNNELSIDDIVLIKTTSATPKNLNGHYEIPINLERNPLNDDVSEFTLGEVIDHVSTIIEDLPKFTGLYPGSTNMRDLGDIDTYGKRFIKHSGPINLPLYHITNKDYNIISAIEYSRDEYSRFKRNFVEIASNLGFDGPVKLHVDKVLYELNKDKVKTQPFYFSDMLASGTPNRIEYNVLDVRTLYYALSNNFNLTTLSPESVLIYLNGTQLTHEVDYTFDNQGFVLIDSYQLVGDTIEIYEYETTDGSYVPSTPTKLGMLPKYAPELTIDTTYISTATVNGAGPFKIYGEVDTFNALARRRGWFYPVYTSKHQAELADSSSSSTKLQFKGLSTIFYAPTNGGSFGEQDNSENPEYPIGVAMIQGHDGSLVKAFKDYRDELILDVENRIFNNIKSTYDNTLLNVDKFVPGTHRKTEYSKLQVDSTTLKDFIQWLRFVDTDYTINDFYDRNNTFTFNYSSMTSIVNGNQLPGFWRGVYKELLDTDRPHSHPWEILGFRIKPNWWNEVYGPAPYTKNNLNLWQDLENGFVKEPKKPLVVLTDYVRPGLINHIPVDEQGNLISPVLSNYAQNVSFRSASNGFTFGDHSPVETAWRRSSEQPFALLKSWMLNKPAQFLSVGFDKSRIKKNLAGQFVYTTTNKHIRLKDIELPNTTSDNSRVSTSGVVNYIYNLIASNVLTVYSDYKTNLASINNQLGIKIGGFTDKTKFKLILDSRAPITTQENSIYVPDENYKIFLNTSSPLKTLSYSGIVIEKSSNGFSVIGYDETNPFFNYYSTNAASSDPVISVGGVSESTTQWRAGKSYVRGQILEENFKFFRVTKNFTSGDTFDKTNLAALGELPIVGGKQATFARSFDKSVIKKLPYGTRLSSSQEIVDFILGYNAYLSDIGFEFEFFNVETQYVENWDHAAREFLFWTTQGWASGTTISLSPGAKDLVLNSSYSVVDNIFDDFYNYGVLKEDGQPLDKQNISIYRDKNTFQIQSKNTDNGLYNVALPLVQKEHVILIDNTTVFNDLIYQPSTGYRQERIKVLGYRSDDWNGSLDIPGFVYDDAKVTQWVSWKDYNIGDLIKYKQFFYVALRPVAGSKEFNNSLWYRLNEKPESKLYTNFDYKINQFADFYDLDSDNFDAEQQRMAQHLIGYQKRNYLSNIINDDVSQYKFYQGFIQDKGTKNAITKLFDPLSTAINNSIDFYEDWAIQVGRYGATNDIEQVEYIIDEEKIKESPQSIELVDTIPTDIIYDKIYRILPSEAYDKPENYNHKPFPTTTLNEYVMSGGYVHEDDVTYKAGSTIDLGQGDINQLSLGDYIWLTRTDSDDWQVYQVSESVARVTTLVDNKITSDANNPLFTLTLDKWAAPILNATDIVAIKGAQDFSINGMYNINLVSGNTIRIELPVDNTAIEFAEESFTLIKLRKVRADNLSMLNSIVQENVYEGQTVWVDDYSSNGSNTWGVYKNTPVYTEQQTITNPAVDDGDSHKFTNSMSATDDNLDLFVSAAENGNGSVYHYTDNVDSSNLVQQTEITAPENLFDITEAKFGESVSAAPDGEYLAVGIPEASNVKTKFKGEFNEFGPSGTSESPASYTKYDIIRYRESVWQANREILPKIGSQPFSTFDTYVNIANAADADSTTVKLLVAGNPGLTVDANHMLVRAPKDMYLGTKAGDRIKLNWNNRSFAFPTLDNYFPFDNTIPELDADFITGVHEIDAKIDSVFLIPAYVALPSIGDFVSSDTGSGLVHYVQADGDTAVVYVKDITGIFALSGEMYIGNEFIGLYTEEDTYNLSDALGGYWLITAPLHNNNGNSFDIGRGLVYVDVLRDVIDDGRTPYEYDNIQSTVGLIGTYIKNSNQASFITNLSYYGDNGGVEQKYETNKWVVRVSDAFTTNVESSGLNSIDFRLYDLDNRDIDIETAGFTIDILNKRQTIVDKWDGYIDFDFTRFDFNGNVFEPLIGDIIEDIQTPFNEFGGFALTSITTSTAEVVYYQRNFNSIRVYVKNITGNWEPLNNIGKYELRRKANSALAPTGRGTSDVDRTIGTIQDFDNDVVLGSKGNSLIGKLFVFEADANFTVTTETWEQVASIIDEEYFFFDEQFNVAGASREANPPNKLNKDYTQIYNIPASTIGTSSELANEGAVALYKKVITDDTYSYSLVDIIVSEYTAENRKFGKKVKLIKHNNLYTLLISSQGDTTRENPGTIEIFKHGYTTADDYAGIWNINSTYLFNQIVLHEGDYFRAVKNVNTQVASSIINPILWNKISWKTSKDENYRGVLDTTYPYAKNSVVSISGRLYRAKTNIAAGAVISLNDWLLITDGLDYVGLLPNLTGNAFYDETLYDPADDIHQFSKDFDVSIDGSILAVVSEASINDSSVDNSGRKQVVIYRLVDNKYSVSQIIDGVDNIDGFANSIAVSPSGTTIAITEPFNDDEKINQGKVYIYKQQSGSFSYAQTLESPQNEESEMFGFSVSFSADNLIVSSINGDMKLPTTFDVAANIDTTFDMEFTQFSNILLDTGVVYIYEHIENSLVFSESIRYDLANSYFGENLYANNNVLYIGMPNKNIGGHEGTLLKYIKPENTLAWTRTRNLIKPVDVSKLRGAFLYNKRQNQIITYLDYIDPIQGKIAGPAEQELTYKVGYDPATYNVSLYSGLDTDVFWAEEHVGQTWWNLRTARFVYPYQGDIQYQKAHWNELQPGSTIDVYEWVESDFLPSNWDGIADTDTGLVTGISGTSVYGDSQYSTKFAYDNISQTFKTKYYFWVERKLTIPAVENRSLSVFDIARLIAQPREQGYRYISFAANNRLILNNCDSLIYNDDVVLNIRYSTSDTIKEQNVHSAYYLMSDGLDTSNIHPEIERKWFDSLIGSDSKLRPVPNTNLTVKQKYGVQTNPRQSMFVNRVEALKQVIERINIVLSSNIIVDEYDISKLLEKDKSPSAVTRRFDVTVDTVDELATVSTNKVTPAIITPIVVNGKLTNVMISSAGRGYKVAPSVVITGAGTGAEINTVINNLGQVISATVTSRGTDYDDNTIITVRKYSTLVNADSSVNGNWAIYEYNDVTKAWSRTATQQYDISTCWKYTDWYDTTVNEFTIPTYTIEQSSDLTSLNDTLNDIVKIKNVGTGGWLLLEKEANEITEDYTINYKTIGRQNGTIQLLDTLYTSTNTEKELRIILNAIKDNIFINTLKVEYNQLFFASLRYILSEQSYVDWLFKTSFVKARHNLGLLQQDVTFNTDTLSSYNSYIEEVKPYKTVVREYVSAYDALDNTNSSVSDFDLPAGFDTYYQQIRPSSAIISEDTIYNTSDNTSLYPRKSWLENSSYTVKSIAVTNAGNGYTYTPIITITGGGGTGATAEAYLGYGKITKIKVTNPGTGYYSAPTVTIEGSIGQAGTPARASAIIGNGVVRTPTIGVKFDRLSKTYTVTTLAEIETFTGTSVNSKFTLEWPMNSNNTKVSITINDVEQLKSAYTYANITNITAGYTREQGQITFAIAPKLNDTIIVNYEKPLSMLDASDRINHGYSPTTTMTGKDLAQLMTGVDYGGVEVTSFDLSGPAGWESQGWFTDSWDTFDNSYEDEIFVLDGSTVAVELSAALEAGTTYNLYKNGVRIDAPDFVAGTDEVPGSSATNINAITSSIIGDGVTEVIFVQDLGIELADNDVFVVRKNTSDGSFIPDPESYDTALSGGDLSYSTARGVNAEEITVDGDGFNTPTTSAGPEELVPGQVLDTLDIKVFTRDSGGTGAIHSQSYVTDSTGPSQLTYNLGAVPGSNPSVIVKVSNVILADSEYTIDWGANTVTISNPSDNTELNITTVERTGQNILDFGTLVADGSSATYETTVEYVNNMSIHVTLDGSKTDVTILNVNNRAAIRFDVTPAEDIVIHYTAFTNNVQVNYSQITKDSFTASGVTNTFVLSEAPFYSLPTAYNILVKVDNKILNAGYNIQFNITDSNRQYKLESFQQPGNALQASDVKVFLNGTEITTPTQWRFDIFTSSINLSDGVGEVGDILEVYVITDGDYQLDGTTLTLDTTPTADSVVEIFNFSNHNILGIERINYDVVSRDTLLTEDIQYVTYNRLTVGEITLRKPAHSTEYVWVTVNSELLSPSIDYYLTDSKTKVVLNKRPAANDIIEVIHFAADINVPKFAYRQFKDILNRTHFKRLDIEETKLAKDLRYFDLRIEVVDASKLPEPNKYANVPGVVFIAGERIEYFVKEGNLLRQLRRGTLGTGVKDINVTGTGVHDQGPSKTIPYKDVTQVQEVTVPDSPSATILLNFKASSVNDFEIFVAGKRLRKTTLESFNPVLALDSPEGDSTLAAEFTLLNTYDGSNNILTSSVVLLDTPVANQKISIMRKIGRPWTDLGVSLGETQTDIGYFLRAGTSALPE